MMKSEGHTEPASPSLALRELAVLLIGYHSKKAALSHWSTPHHGQGGTDPDAMDIGELLLSLA